MPLPFEWWVSRLCEEFHCLPSAALREWEHAPVGLLEQILEYRAYARAKAIYDAADTPQKRQGLPDSPLFDVIQEMDFELAREALEEAQKGHG